MISRMVAGTLVVVVLATLVYGCGKTGSPAKKRTEREAAGQAETPAPESPAPTHASRSASGETSGEEQAGVEIVNGASAKFGA
jgi:hypothetical protein